MTPRIGVHLARNDNDAAATRRDVLTRPAYGIFATADEKHLALAALETPFWRRLVKTLALSEAGSACAG